MGDYVFIRLQGHLSVRQRGPQGELSGKPVFSPVIIKAKPNKEQEMSTKEAVIEMIKRLPDDVTLSAIMAELNFRQHIDEGLRQLDGGEGLAHEEVKRQLGQWLN